MKAHPASTTTAFRALTDETRLRLVNLLLEREMCVCELYEVLDLAQPNASRHLAYLRRAGFVTVRQVGKWKYYSLPRQPTGLLRRLLDCVRSCRRGMDVLRDDVRRLRASAPGEMCR